MMKNSALRELADKPDKIWNRNFTLLFIANIMLYLSLTMVNTLVPKFADSLGSSSTTVGAVTGAFAYSCLLLKVVSAPAIDSFNKKLILAGFMSVTALSFLGCAVSNSIPRLVGSRLLQGVGQAFTAACCLTLAAEFVPADRLGSGIGYFSLAQTSCQAVGPTVGLWVQNAFGYKAAFTTGMIIMLIGALIALLLKPVRQHKKRFSVSIKSIFAREAVLPAALSMLTILVFFNINSFLILYAEDVGIGNSIGLFFSVYAVTLIITRPIIGKLLDSYGILKVLFPAFLFFALSFILISFSRTLVMFFVSAAVSAFGCGVCLPALQTLCMKSVSSDRRGAGSCTCFIGQDIGSLLGPVIGGILRDYFGYANMWRLMTIPIFVAAIIAFAFRTSIKSIDDIYNVK